MSQVDIQGTPLWRAFSACRTPDQVAEKTAELIAALDKQPNTFALDTLLEGNQRHLSSVQILKLAFENLMGVRLACHDLDPLSTVADATAFFALVTLSDPGPIPFKRIALFANNANPTQAKLSFTEKPSKPVGFTEVWSLKVVDVGKNWKQVFFSDTLTTGNVVALEKDSSDRMKTQVLSHESQLKVRCYCGRLLRCDLAAIFAHLSLNQCAALTVKDCKIKGCAGGHVAGCLETDWTCERCNQSLRLRDRERHDKTCAEHWFLKCWICGAGNRTLADACAHPCFAIIKQHADIASSAKAQCDSVIAAKLKHDFLDVEAITRSDNDLLKVIIDGLCRYRQVYEALTSKKKKQPVICEVEKYANIQFQNKKHIGYERFADAKPYLLPSHGRCELILKPRPDGHHPVPRYLMLESVEELAEVSAYTDHSVAIKSGFKHLVRTTEFRYLSDMKHHIEVVGCGLRDVSVFANATHAVDLRDNALEDVSPLAGVYNQLFLSRNRIRDVSVLKCKSNLFVDHNLIADASTLVGLSVLDVRGNPLENKVAVVAQNNTVFVD